MLQVKCKTLSSNTIEISNRYPIICGTAQGSCLGPLLFNIFCNDIYENVKHCNLISFADDTTLYASHRNTNYLNFMLQEDIENLNSWFRVNKLSLNLQKTSAMLFLPKQSINNNTNLNLKIDNEPLPIVTQTKFLGITIDNQLTWKEHINNILRKISINLSCPHISSSILCKHCMERIHHNPKKEATREYAKILYMRHSKKKLKTTIQIQYSSNLKSCLFTNER